MELPVLIPHDRIDMVGVVHRPTNERHTEGVIIVVGGPQNRWGSHRQFLLLARFLCNRGIPVLRFDCGGMGDSEGDKQEFLDAGPYLRSAIDFFSKLEDLESIALWGLCDAVSVSLLYLNSWQDRRISAVFALNPWVRQSQTEAQVVLKRYYWRRLISPLLWKKVFSFRFDFFGSLTSFLMAVKKALSRPKSKSRAELISGGSPWGGYNEDNYIDAMLSGLNAFKGNFYLMLSGNDLTADEFKALVEKNPVWQKTLAEKCRRKLEVEGANHTFASHEWRSIVEEFTYSCLMSPK